MNTLNAKIGAYALLDEDRKRRKTFINISDATSMEAYFKVYVDAIYRAYKLCIPYKNKQEKLRVNLLDIFDNNVKLYNNIDSLKYMQHFNLRDGVLWLRNEVFKDLNISLSADIKLDNLSGYVNGDLINFNIRATDTNKDYSIFLSGKTITYLMNINKIVNEALIEVDNNVGLIEAVATGQKYNAFIYLNNVNGDSL